MCDHIINEAARQYGWAAEDILGRSRTQSLMLARHTVIYCLHHGLNHSKREIADRFNRNHATIIGSLKVSADLMRLNPAFKRAQETIWANAVKAYAPQD